MRHWKRNQENRESAVFWLTRSEGNIDPYFLCPYNSEVPLFNSIANSIKKLASKSFRGPLESRLVKRFGHDAGGKPDHYAVQVRGGFSPGITLDLAFTISVLIVLPERHRDPYACPRPMFSSVENFQEAHSPAYFMATKLGTVHGGFRFPDWATICAVIPEVLVPPRSDMDQASVVLRLMPEYAVEKVYQGRSPSLWESEEVIGIERKNRGYMDAADIRKEVLGLSVSLAVSVAMADGKFDDEEGETIQRWMTRNVKEYPKLEQDRAKASLNQALRDAYARRRDYRGMAQESVGRINEIAEVAEKYVAIELCYKVMAADGEANQNEIELLHELGSSLGLDNAQLEKIRDPIMIELQPEPDSSDPASLLGIDDAWDDQRKRKHLEKEFGKWAPKVTVLQPGPERDYVEMMLDLIGKELSKYDR